jgi:hypothetical protein
VIRFASRPGAGGRRGTGVLSGEAPCGGREGEGVRGAQRYISLLMEEGNALRGSLSMAPCAGEGGEREECSAVWSRDGGGALSGVAPCEERNSRAQLCGPLWREGLDC